MGGREGEWAGAGSTQVDNGLARRFTGGRLVVATHNAGKLAEIADLLAPLGVDVVSAAALGLAEPEETGVTFAANAELKAHAAAEASGLVALADDSGLVVAALDGAPGIHSARWAGPERDFRAAMERVERELADKVERELADKVERELADKVERELADKVKRELAGGTDRRAHFVAALALAWPDGRCETVEGRIDGTLVWPPRGERGFGYDPMFLPDGHGETFGEMDQAVKHRISHRADAFRKLMAACFEAA